MPMSDVREFTLLLEKSKGLLGRLEWLYKNTKDKVVFFNTVDLVAQDLCNGPWRAGQASYTPLGLEKSRTQLYRDIRDLEEIPRDDTSVPLDTLLGKYIQQTLFTEGKWFYDDKNPLPQNYRAEKIIPWIARWIKQDDMKQVKVLCLRSKRGTIFDWWEATRPDMAKYSPNQAYYWAIRWHNKLKKQEDEKDEIAKAADLKLIASLDKGVEIFELKPFELSAEGATMKHCIGSSPSYAEAVRKGEARALSIRQNRKRVFTIFIEQGEVSQFKGKANRTFENCKPEEQGVALIAGRWLDDRGLLPDRTSYGSDTDALMLILNEERGRINKPLPAMSARLDQQD